MASLPNLSKAAWLNAPATQKILTVLDGQGGQVQARCVGGCVRNTLMRNPVSDIDIATSLKPETAREVLMREGIAVFDTGLSHGTITARLEEQNFEVTTLRTDIKTDGRHAEVKYTEDWAGDAGRRDFYLNAVYVDRHGQLLDPTGQGIEDTLNCRVRFIGDAEARIQEDYLRIMRYFRFSAHYAVGFDETGLAACKQNMAGIASLSGERIWSELKKIFASDALALALGPMQNSGLINACLRQFNIMNVRKLLEFEVKIGKISDPILRVFAGFVDVADIDIAHFKDRLRLSNAELSHLQNLRKALDKTGFTAQAIAYYFGKNIARSVMLIRGARGDQTIDAADFKAMETFTIPQFPVNGNDLKMQGLSGKALGNALKNLEEIWVKSSFTLTKEALLHRL